jgi:hypothetical protein
MDIAYDKSMNAVILDVNSGVCVSARARARV